MILIISVTLVAAAREQSSLDAGWWFHPEPSANYAGCIANMSFLLALDSLEGDGLRSMGASPTCLSRWPSIAWRATACGTWMP